MQVFETFFGGKTKHFHVISWQPFLHIAIKVCAWNEQLSNMTKSISYRKIRYEMHVRHDLQVVNSRATSSKISLTYIPKRDRNIISFLVEKLVQNLCQNYQLSYQNLMKICSECMSTWHRSKSLTFCGSWRSSSAPKAFQRPPHDLPRPPQGPKGRSPNEQNSPKDCPRRPQGLQRRPKASQGPPKAFQRHLKGLSKFFRRHSNGFSTAIPRIPEGIPWLVLFRLV